MLLGSLFGDTRKMALLKMGPNLESISQTRIITLFATNQSFNQYEQEFRLNSGGHCKFQNSYKLWAELNRARNTSQLGLCNIHYKVQQRLHHTL